MQNRTNLGMSIGQMLSSASGGGNSYLQGQQAGADMAYRKAATDKMLAEADAERAGIAARSDDTLKKTLLAGIGADSEDGLRDLDASLSGNYKPPTQPLAFIDGGKELPAPEYVSKFPELQNRYSTLKQMLALGDKDITHLPKSIQGDQRNRVTAGLENATPQQAAEIGMRASALEGNVNPLEMQKAAILYGLVNGNNGLDNQNALLLSQGKTRYDNTGDVGVMDVLTGNQNLNVIGTTKADENVAKAGQANSAAGLNNAKVGQTISATNLNNANVGLVNAKTQNETTKLTSPKAKTQLSPTAQKELFEAEDVINSSTNTIDMLNEALRLNKTAYSGIGAKTAATAVSNTPFVDKTRADATVQLDNLMTGQALESLKAVFGGMPTEGERKILLDIQASADKTPVQRAGIIKRGIEMAERRMKASKAKAKSLRDGSFFNEQPMQEEAKPAAQPRTAPTVSNW